MVKVHRILISWLCPGVYGSIWLQPNPSYQFGFDVKDDQFTNYQTRKEERDGKTITGSYSVVDADGYIRTVKYTADPKEGFKAEVMYYILLYLCNNLE